MNIRTPISTTTAALLLGLCVAAGAPQARAADVDSERVGFADLDMSRTAGAERLYHRLQSAARRVCGPSGRILSRERAREQCTRQALDEAVASVGSPLLASLHDRRTGQASAAAAVASR